MARTRSGQRPEVGPAEDDLGADVGAGPLLSVIGVLPEVSGRVGRVRSGAVGPVELVDAEGEDDVVEVELDELGRPVLVLVPEDDEDDPLELEELGVLELLEPELPELPEPEPDEEDDDELPDDPCGVEASGVAVGAGCGGRCELLLSDCCGALVLVDRGRSLGLVPAGAEEVETFSLAADVVEVVPPGSTGPSSPPELAAWSGLPSTLPAAVPSWYSTGTW